jgi:intracellular septation protein
MKLLFDLFPLLVFYTVYRFKDIYWATGALIISSALLLLWMRICGRKIEKIYIIGFLVLLVLGSTTILVHDDTFLKWRPTVVNALFAAVFWFSPYFGGGKPLTQRMLGSQMHMSPGAWRAMNHAWAVFFLCISVLNIVVAYTCSQKVWVNFKVFGVLGLTLVFMVGVMMAFGKRITPVEQPGEKPPPA